MGRTSWSEYGDDDPLAQGRFVANLKRSMRGKAGQAALRELQSALLNMHEKELYSDVFVEMTGEMCALGAVAVARKVAEGLSRDEALATCADVDPDESEQEGERLGFPSLVAQAVVWENDEAISHVLEVAYGPVNPSRGIYEYKGGIALIREVTPRERYDAMLKWVQRRLSTDVSHGS